MLDDKTVQKLCYHSHNFFCDGHHSPEEMLQSAVNQNVNAFGFSSHSPLKFLNKWSISMNNLNKLMDIVNNLRLKYSSKIQIYKSLEADYIPNYSYSFDFFRNKYSLDYIIGSVHLVLNPQNDEILFIDGPADKFVQNLNRVFNGNIKKAVETYVYQNIEMLQTQNFEILGHMDRINVNATKAGLEVNSSWYNSLLDIYLKEIKKENVIVEINTRAKYKGKYDYTNPSVKTLEKMKRLDIPVIISTDAHKTNEITLLYNESLQELKNINYHNIVSFNGEEWKLNT